MEEKEGSSNANELISNDLQPIYFEFGRRIIVPRENLVFEYPENTYGFSDTTNPDRKRMGTVRLKHQSKLTTGIVGAVDYFYHPIPDAVNHRRFSIDFQLTVPEEYDDKNLRPVVAVEIPKKTLWYTLDILSPNQAQHMKSLSSDEYSNQKKKPRLLSKDEIASLNVRFYLTDTQFIHLNQNNHNVTNNNHRKPHADRSYKIFEG